MDTSRRSLTARDAQGRITIMFNDSESLVEALCWFLVIASVTALLVVALRQAHWGNLLW